MIKICTFTTHKGVPMAAKLVPIGRRYGAGLCCVHSSEKHHEDDPLVEFYDLRYDHTELGQFISRYYLSTLQEKPYGGLCLAGGVPEWVVDAKSFSYVMWEFA